MTKRPITHVATTDIRDMMNPGPERRMDLPGFDPEFVDFPHYIIRITERIWHDREVELCLRYYADDCVIHTMAGPIVGAQTVVSNTYQTLEAFPDRRLDGDNVIWSKDEKGVFHSSHLITSKMTNLGPTEFGVPTGRKARVQTIADCLCKENKVIEEWLVRDNAALCIQLGFDVAEQAARLAEIDAEQGTSLLDKLLPARENSPSEASVNASEATQLAANALRSIWQGRKLNSLDQFYDFRAACRYPALRDAYGYDQLADLLTPIVEAFSDAELTIEHVAETPYLCDAVDVALRWSVLATHSGYGDYGVTSGGPVYILGVSHYRVMNGRIREETTIWDDVALHRQIAAARLG